MDEIKSSSGIFQNSTVSISSSAREALMSGPSRHIHPQHRDQQIRRMTTSVLLHLIAVVILVATLLILLIK